MEKKAILVDLVKRAKDLTKNYKIILLANVKGETQSTNDFSDFSVSAEYYNPDVQQKIRSAFQHIGFDVICMYDEKECIEYCLKHQAECRSFIMVNSAQKGTKIGRKSLIPAFCDLMDIRYVGSNPYVVSLCRDKYRSGKILAEHSISTPTSWLYSPVYGWVNGEPDPNAGKMIVKPNYEASSIGIDNSNVLPMGVGLFQKVYSMSKDFSQDIIVEKFIAGYEIETPVICRHKPMALFPVAISMGGNRRLGEQILDYKTRSNNGYTFYNFFDENSALAEHLCELAEKVCTVLNITGFGRVDFRVSSETKVYVTDISTNPHYTEQSSYFFPFKQWGLSYDDMVACILSPVLERR